MYRSWYALVRDFFPNYWDYKVPMWSKWEEKDDKLILKVAVPGYEKEDFNIYVEDGSLCLEIKSKKGNLSYSILDRFYDDRYKFDEAEAEYVNGVLVIKIPKNEKKKTKQISIKVS